MKRIDLHIHTIASPLDHDFEFDSNVLLERVKSNHLDAIAVTNHNVFNRANYEEVRSCLPESVCVFPGVEVSVEGFHVLVIASPNRTDSLEEACSKIPNIKQGDSGIAIGEFRRLFGDGSYIVIPHYKKKPSISSHELELLTDLVTALEVSSDKKWCYESRLSNMPIVLFSDCRCGKNDNAVWGRYTYVSIGDITFDALRLAFRDKSKFSITERENHFELMPGLYVSSGLNVIVGGRSSGKTYLLDRISESCDPDDLVYVRQFGIVKDAEDKKFNELLADEEASIKEDYYGPMATISSEVLRLPSREEMNSSIKDYLSGLVLFADSSAREDEYSKCPIYGSGKIAKETAKQEEEVVQAVLTLLKDDGPLSKEIDELLGRGALISLLRIAVDRYRAKLLRCKCIDLANEISKKIKASLSLESSRPSCPESPLVEAMRRKAYIMRLAKLRGATKSSKTITTKTIGKFKRITKRVPYQNATAVKTAIGATSSLGGVLRLGDIEYVEEILAADGVSDIKRALFDVSVELVNSRGEEVSGGQKAEYLFFRALDRAASHDVVLIDEPESSFDNPFLNSLIATELKKIAMRATVFISTHNNVLGVSIKPDGLIYTSYENGAHRIYSCDSSDDLMRSPDGETTRRSEVLLQLMEAGDSAYRERRPYYGIAES